jgi:hypothetical protein
MVTEVAGLLWTKTTWSSHRNYRSADERFFVGPSFKKFWWLYDSGRKLPGAFKRPEEAMAFAAALSPQEAS